MLFHIHLTTCSNQALNPNQSEHLLSLRWFSWNKAFTLNIKKMNVLDRLKLSFTHLCYCLSCHLTDTCENASEFQLMHLSFDNLKDWKEDIKMANMKIMHSGLDRFVAVNCEFESNVTEVRLTKSSDLTNMMSRLIFLLCNIQILRFSWWVIMVLLIPCAHFKWFKRKKLLNK